MPDFVTRTGQMTQAVNTMSNITTDPTGVSSAIQVPANRSKLAGMYAVVTLSAETATDSGGVFIIRLSGNGLAGGQQDIIVAGVMSIAQGTPATGIINDTAPVWIPLDLDVTSGNAITIQGAYSGVDFGTPEVGVTLRFE